MDQKMSSRVELTEKEKLEIEQLKALPLPRKLEGECAGCHRGIPVGYFALVTKWKTRTWTGGTKVMVPAEQWCQDCRPVAAGKSPSKNGSSSKSHPVIENKVSNTPLNELLAKKLKTVMSKEKAHSPRWMMKRLGINPEQKQQVVDTLKKLYSDKQIEFEDGQWKLV